VRAALEHRGRRLRRGKRSVVPSCEDFLKITVETDMPRTLKTEAELFEIVTDALEADPTTKGWAPRAIQRHADDADGCNWNVRDIHRASADADVSGIAGPAAARIIEAIRARYNLR
jgi:hypothetical protein